MLDDVPSFWKKGDKRRVRVEFADTLLKAGWARLADEEPRAKPEEKK